MLLEGGKREREKKEDVLVDADGSRLFQAEIPSASIAQWSTLRNKMENECSEKWSKDLLQMERGQLLVLV